MPVIQIGKTPEAIRDYRAQEVKDAHDTLHHDRRGPHNGRGASNHDSSTSRERDRREHSGERSNPGHRGPRLNRVPRTPIEVGREIQGDSPATNKSGLIAGSKRQACPQKAIRRPAQNERSTRALPQAGEREGMVSKCPEEGPQGTRSRSQEQGSNPPRRMPGNSLR